MLRHPHSYLQKSFRSHTMEYLIIIGCTGCLLLTSILLAFWSYRLLKKRTTRSNIAFLTLLLLAGLCVGIYLGFFFKYHTSPSKIVASFPLPAAIFIKEDDIWVDYIAPLILVIVVTNTIFNASLFLLPFIAGNYLYRFFPKSHNSPDTYP